MPKLPRVTAKIYADNAAATDIAQFGSVISGSTVYTSDIAQIQALPAYETGWRAAVISDENYPTLVEFNGLQKTFSQQIAYILQNGMIEWDASTEYYTEQFCRVGKVIYYSLSDNNIGNNPETDTTNWAKWNPVAPLPPDYTINLKADGTGDFETIQDALDFISQHYVMGNVYIDLEDGTYLVNSTIRVPYNLLQFKSVSNFIFLRGKNGTASTVIIKAAQSMNQLIGFVSSSCLIVGNITLDGANLADIGIGASYSGTVRINGDIVIKNSKTGIDIRAGSNLNLGTGTNITISNVQTGIISVYGANMQLWLATINITASAAGLYCSDNSSMYSNAGTITVKAPIGIRCAAQSSVVLLLNAKGTITGSTNAILTIGNSFVQLGSQMTTSGTVSPAFNTSGNQNSYNQK